MGPLLFKACDLLVALCPWLRLVCTRCHGGSESSTEHSTALAEMAGDALRIADLGTVADAAAGVPPVSYEQASVAVACRLEPARPADGLTIDCEVESAAFDAPEINGGDVARALQSCLAPGGGIYQTEGRGAERALRRGAVVRGLHGGVPRLM